MRVEAGSGRTVSRRHALRGAVLGIAAAAGGVAVERSDVELSPLPPPRGDGALWVELAAERTLALVHLRSARVLQRIPLAAVETEWWQDGRCLVIAGESGIKALPPGRVAPLLLPESAGSPSAVFGCGGGLLAILDRSGALHAVGLDGRSATVRQTRALPGSEGAEPRSASRSPAELAEVGEASLVVSAEGDVLLRRGATVLAWPSRHDGSHRSPVVLETEGLADGSGDVEMTVVGRVPVLLDRIAGELRIGLSGARFDLLAAGLSLAALRSARLQLPSAAGPAALRAAFGGAPPGADRPGAGSEVVLFSSADALWSIPLGRTVLGPSSVPSGGAGVPLPPVRSRRPDGEIWVAAWTGTRRCVLREATGDARVVTADSAGPAGIRAVQAGPGGIIALESAEGGPLLRVGMSAPLSLELVGIEAAS